MSSSPPSSSLLLTDMYLVSNYVRRVVAAMSDAAPQTKATVARRDAVNLLLDQLEPRLMWHVSVHEDCYLTWTWELPLSVHIELTESVQPEEKEEEDADDVAMTTPPSKKKKKSRGAEPVVNAYYHITGGWRQRNVLVESSEMAAWHVRNYVDEARERYNYTHC